MSPYELPLREWAVIFYPQTGAARLCPTLDFAKNTVTSDSSFYSHVYKSPRDFRQRHDHAFLEKCWRELHKSVSWRFPKTAVGSLEDYSPEPPDTDTENFVNLLWDFIQDVGDRLTAPRMEASKTKENYEIKMDAVADLVADEERFKNTYNKQARTVLLALFNNQEQFLSEEQIKRIIFQLVAERELKTRQKPWVVFQYYRPQFIKDGFIVRGRAPKK